MTIEFNPSLNSQDSQDGKVLKKGVAKTKDLDVAVALKGLGKVTRYEPTKALEKLNKLKASNGMTYKEAKAKMEEIEQKYINFDNNKYVKKVEDLPPMDSSRATFAVSRFHFEVDENALPEPDRTEYGKAKAAIVEIRYANGALVSEASLNLKF